jgi:uncharacterized protein (DUF1499 family)
MRGIRAIAGATLAAVLILAAFGLALRVYMNAAGQNQLLPSERIAIAELRSPLPQPSFLACPPGDCRAGEAHASPVFAIPVPRLQELWRRTIAAEPRVVEVTADMRAGHFVYVVHTPLLGFPDIVTVEFVALGVDRSGIAVFSRSRYGRSDFGANRRRVERWLALLAKRAAPSPNSDPRG